MPRTFGLTRSQPRNLLSILKLKSASSRIQRSIWKRTRRGPEISGLAWRDNQTIGDAFIPAVRQLSTYFNAMSGLEVSKFLPARVWILPVSA